MAQREDYRGGENNDYQDEQYEEIQVDEVPWYRLADPDYDPDEGDFEYGLEDDQEPPERREQVEYRLDHAADDAAQLDAEARFGGWKSRARRRRMGRFVPPDVRDYRWPVFVRVADLTNRDED